MSDRKRLIETLKEVFLHAKNEPRDEDNWPINRKIYSDLVGAIVDVGKEQIHELKDEVYPYLNDPHPDFRAEAVKTLGWGGRLDLEDFQKQQAYQIWLNDRDEDVKIVALVAWARLYLDTKNPDTLKKLYEILIDHDYTSEIRMHALYCIFDVSDAWNSPAEKHGTLELGDLKDEDEFDKAVDWDRIHRVMKACVPGWEENKI